MQTLLRALKSRTASVVTVGLLTLAPTAMFASAAHADVSGNICQTALPSQADDTLNLIAQGGPFPYSQDGETFQNREGVLPSEPNGYYQEYTVITPGAPTRGTRRIITGEDGSDYYTSDHYVSFYLIDTTC
ncbi:ribonuclease domain-containing protein [Kitasatospora sp. GAS204B]|uniref:ribonuclease domain-containing protein n=1 Tax=unclassified Kitasatospora TaxID=2633591 RepID=UPI0024764760|nr:ribonuclease domain-containing protein [Kitasatospora sp. GAS204B]MDH6119942.1 ribonuclease T1 [Kitasatospora sp. GAS204B]